MALPTHSLPNLVIKLITEVVKDQLNYLVNYDKKFEELEGAVDYLLVERRKVVDRVKEEQDRYGRVVYDDVTGWLDEVDNVLSEFENFKKDEDRKHAGCSLNNFPPNLVIRYRCSKIADDIKAKVEGLLQTVKRDDVSRWQGPPSMVVAFSNVDYQSFESRIKTLEDIMAQLRGSSTRMIGVHGPTGVGKTTLVIKAALMAWKEEQLFGEVIMANVTKSPDIRKIQGQIADMLGMKLEEESEQARAIRIQERLKKEKESTLIIIDDLRAKVDLNMLGIPTENGDGSRRNLKDGKSTAPGAHNMMEAKQTTTGPSAIKTDKASGAPSKLKTEERYKGCKVVLISEVRQVLSQMDVEKDLIFSVNILKDKEAESLFMKMAGVGDKNYEFGKLAAQIAKKCNGLPMSIVTTAKALKNQTRSVWEDTWLKLQRQKLTGTPEYSTKLSYKLLENEELKIIFLLCARMGHDALVSDLVKYCIGLGFLQGIYTVREARDRVQASVAKLKQSGLLSDSYSSDRFTMQNLVRDAALSIAVKESHVFTLTEGRLDEWPDADRLKRYTAISLRYCDIIEKFPKSINCPRLRVFQLDNNDQSLTIPDNFFQQMKELRVLILTGINLSPLPSSIRCLTKLRMLCLEQCILDKQSFIIGELKNLRILSFSGSDIKQLPIELMHLSKLQIFDISYCSKLRVIPPNVISSMTNLEELYMRNVSIQWRVDGEHESQCETSSLSELGHLNQLTNLDIQIPSVAHLPKNLFFDRLYSYKIVIGSPNRYSVDDFKMPEMYELSSYLAIQQKDSFDIHSQKGIKMLFENVESLLLEKLHGVRDIFYELNLKGFPYLKHLSIVSNSDIQALISPEDRKHSELAFPKLESLVLYDLKNMMKISSCKLSKSSFGKLKMIKIKLCGQLESVFLKSIVTLLSSLETIQVSECNSLKEIVHVDNTENTKQLKFPELRTLVLQSLSEFIGFCPFPPTEGTKILFHKEVDISKLEKLELSSIQIRDIWIGHCPHFQNLVHLDVNACRNLKYLMPVSMIRNLEKLQSLFVSECENMEHIFPEEWGRDAQIKELKHNKIFPKLKNIKLSRMKNLIEIWNFEVPVDAIGKLDTLVIEECNTLVHVFTCHLVGIFQSLSSLKATNCKSMKSIFDLADSKRDARYETRLQDVHFETLPKLEHILKCNEDQEKLLKLDNLQKIWVHDCDSLENLFPVSIAKNLKKLEYLVVWDCFGLREIVAKGKDVNNQKDLIQFEFSALTTIKLSELPKLRNFHPGPYKLSFEVLNDLSVELCDQFEPFREETANMPAREQTTDEQSNNILFPEKVLNNLKSMQVELRHAKSSKCNRRDKLEELHLSRLENTDILYSFLHSNPYLKSLWLDNCSFEVLVPDGRPPGIEGLGVVPRLKSLKLTDLPYLKKIGFEIDAILQRIEYLVIKHCPCLDSIAPSKDININISLTHLTNLEVADCEGLKYLMPPSTAKSLSQLSIMKIINCESLEEIVSDQQGGKIEENAEKIKIIFKQLKLLELVSLENLKSFCSSKNFAFDFPALEKFVVRACPKMENFSEQVKCTRSLQKIYVVHEKEKKRWFWEGNLKDTIQYIFKEKKFFEGMEMLSVSDHLELEVVWQSKDGLQNDWFYSLKTLKLENCKFESYAIPYHVLSYLKSLKELEVRNCNNVIVIFEMNGSNFSGTFHLMKLTLEGLPNVTHVWQRDKQGIQSFQNLEQVTVTDCQKLKALFPAALATDLNVLEELEVGYCDELLEIIENEERIEKFVFPQLATVTLYDLPQLTHFHAERLRVECPKLNDFYVYNCVKLELFPSQQEALPQGEGSSTSTIRHPFFSDIKDISKLEDMGIRWKDISALRLWLAQFTDQELQDLNLLYLYSEDDVSENFVFPFEILEKAPNLDTVKIGYSRSLMEIFPRDNGNIGDEERVVGHLKNLFLYVLYGLHSIDGLEQLLKLQKLCLYQCPSLTRLGESCSNLRELEIGECHGLEFLFTSSAANKLMHLEEIHVWDCESMKKMVENEEAIEEIKFERLERIIFDSLSKLECFYSGNATLKFPSLTRVEIRECSSMKVFSEGIIHVESSYGIQVSFDSGDDFTVHKDLNDVFKERFLYQTELDLDDYSEELEKKWLGSEPVPSNWSFGNLKSLMVKDCDFLSNAILPSHLLRSLSNLEVLEVRKCESVEAIFDVKDTPANDSNMIVIRLKRLVLDQLPSLWRVWNEDPKGRLSLPVLEEVFVDECNRIESLFPASVATKDNLQTLRVKSCEKLVEIVAEDETATKNVNKANNIFRSMKSLSLFDLPNLRCICSGMHIIDWPVLELLIVYHCPLLKILATNFQNSPDIYSEGQDHTAPDEHFFVSAEKVTPQLFCISLNKEDVINTEHGLLQLNLQKVSTLRLQSFDGNSDAFPDVFFSMVPLPKIEWLVVIDCAFKEIFPSQRPDLEYNKILSRLEGLELKSMHKLSSLVLEHTSMAGLLENLKYLKVKECSCLTNLAPPTVSFTHLNELTVKDCNKLEYLFTSSTAKSFVVLNNLSITRCESLEKVVAEEGDRPDEAGLLENLKYLKVKECSCLTNLAPPTVSFIHLNELTVMDCNKLEYLFTYSTAKSFVMLNNLSITRCESLEKVVAEEVDKPDEDVIFRKLTTMSLTELPKLGSFYTGSSTLNFPYLNSISFSQCENMTTFSHGDILPKLLNVKIDGVRWYGDLNTAVQKWFENEESD